MNLSSTCKKAAYRFALLLAGVGLTAGAAMAQIYVHVGPPRPIREHRPPLRPCYVWQAGYHRWDGNRYVLVPGAYVAPPRPHAMWVPGRWVHTRHGWMWREGHWR